MKQPARSAKDAEVMKGVDDAMTDASAKAKAAKTTKDACAVLDPLSDKMKGLEHVTPPKGFEHEFAEARDGLGMLEDHIESVTCPDAQAAPGEVVDGLAKLHDRFHELEGIGAK